MFFLEWQPKDLLLVNNDSIAKELKDDTDTKRDAGSLALLEKKSVDYLQNQISNLEKEIAQAINQKQDSSITIDSIKNNTYILPVKDIPWVMMIKQKIESIEKLKENLAESQLKENAYKQYQKLAATFYVYQDWVKR